MQVLTHAHQKAAKKLDREAEAQQKAQIQELLERRKMSTKKYAQSLKNLSDSDDATEDEGENGEEDNRSMKISDRTTISIGSSINLKTLETCVHHVRSLLDDVEKLHQALTQQVDDHSEHHQSLVGSYIRAREHLDGVLFSGTQQSSRTASIHVDDFRIQSGPVGDQIAIQKTLTGSTLHSTVLKNSTSDEVDLAKAVQEAVEKARHEEKMKLRFEAETLRAEKGAAQSEVDRKLQEYERLLIERSTEDLRLTATEPARQLLFKFRNTFGAMFTLPFHTCNTWEVGDLPMPPNNIHSALLIFVTRASTSGSRMHTLAYQCWPLRLC